jgi:hypothetical protein
VLREPAQVDATLAAWFSGVNANRLFAAPMSRLRIKGSRSVVS